VVTKTFGTIPSNPGDADTTFFRLWNGIAKVADFANTLLPNNLGISLAFEAPAGSNYIAGDYWDICGGAPAKSVTTRCWWARKWVLTCSARAPRGIHYHRVPLAVLTWANNLNVVVPIEDCRHLFQPLTRLATCCSYRVGDGMHSWGDFQKIQDAINSLPPAGGEICVLPANTKRISRSKPVRRTSPSKAAASEVASSPSLTIP